MTAILLDDAKYLIAKMSSNYSTGSYKRIDSTSSRKRLRHSCI